MVSDPICSARGPISVPLSHTGLRIVRPIGQPGDRHVPYPPRRLAMVLMGIRSSTSTTQARPTRVHELQAVVVPVFRVLTLVLVLALHMYSLYPYKQSYEY